MHPHVQVSCTRRQHAGHHGWPVQHAGSISSFARSALLPHANQSDVFKHHGAIFCPKPCISASCAGSCGPTCHQFIPSAARSSSSVAGSQPARCKPPAGLRLPKEGGYIDAKYLDTGRDRRQAGNRPVHRRPSTDSRPSVESRQHTDGWSSTDSRQDADRRQDTDSRPSADGRPNSERRRHIDSKQHSESRPSTDSRTSTNNKRYTDSRQHIDSSHDIDSRHRKRSRPPGLHQDQWDRIITHSIVCAPTVGVLSQIIHTHKVRRFSLALYP